MKKRNTEHDKLVIIQMWNAGVPSKLIEEQLGIKYPISIRIGQYRKSMGLDILNKEERLVAVACWKAESQSESRSGDTDTSPWELAYAQVQKMAGSRSVPAIGESTVELVVSILVDGEEVSRETTTILKPARRALGEC